MLAVKWRAKGSSPIKSVDECKEIWENPTGQKIDVADPSSPETIVSIENVDAPDDRFL